MADPGPPISRNIRAELARAGITGDDMARNVLRISRGAWTRRISGKVPWSYEELQTIAYRLGVPLARLTEEPKP